MTPSRRLLKPASEGSSCAIGTRLESGGSVVSVMVRMKEVEQGCFGVPASGGSGRRACCCQLAGGKRS